MARGISRSCVSREGHTIVNQRLTIYSAGADFIFIPERPPTAMPWEDEMCAQIHRVRRQAAATSFRYSFLL
jgi:hypothetical protein